MAYRIGMLQGTTAKNGLDSLFAPIAAHSQNQSPRKSRRYVLTLARLHSDITFLADFYSMPWRGVAWRGAPLLSYTTATAARHRLQAASAP